MQGQKDEYTRINSAATECVYNLYGENSRVNNHSTDQSVNIVNTSPDDLFDKIRQTIKESIDDENERRELRILVNELEDKQNTSNFNQLYTKFIISAANHMTLISSFIPALSQLIK